MAGRRGRVPGREIVPGFRKQGRAIWTLNATPRKNVYGETLLRTDEGEWRRWDPSRSKLGAALVLTANHVSDLLPLPGTQVLYLGAGHGTTISHLHDILCGEDNNRRGRIVAVDLAPRCLRDLNHLAHSRPGLVPLLADARRHAIVGAIQPQRVDWLFQDVAQASQVDIFISACKRFLNKGGSGLFSLKAASERWDEDGERAMFEKVADVLLNSGMEIVEQIDLAGYEDNHMLFHCRNI